MENNTSRKSLAGLLKNPSDLIDIMNNPGKSGMDFFNSLSTKEKQYILYAAGASLIIYGITLGKKGKR